MKYIKQVLFWTVAIPILALMVAVVLLEWSLYLYFGIFGVVRLAVWRFECWSFDVKKDSLMNCPWKTTYKEAWEEELKWRGY